MSTQGIDALGGVGSSGGSKRPSMMDVWKSSLQPETQPQSGGQDPSMDQMMKLLQTLLPLLAQMAKQAAGGGSDPGAGGGSPMGAQPPQGATGAQSQGGPGAQIPQKASAAQQPPAAGAASQPASSSASPTPAAGAADGASGGKPGGGGSNPANAGSSGGSSGATPGASGIPGVSKNSGGVLQANAISGVNPNSVDTEQTGTGTDKVYNFTNGSSHEESITYSTDGQQKGKTITLDPGQTGAFVAGSGDEGVRITPTTPTGSSNPNEVLYEDGGAANGQAAGVGNADISKVDGNQDAYGNAMNMTVTLSDGRVAGDGNANHAYANPTDDAASMALAGDPSKTANIVLSDA